MLDNRPKIMKRSGVRAPGAAGVLAAPPELLRRDELPTVAED